MGGELYVAWDGGGERLRCADWNLLLQQWLERARAELAAAMVAGEYESPMTLKPC